MQPFWRHMFWKRADKENIWTREEGGRCWRRLHNEEIHVRVFKSRRMRWTEHVACVWVMKNTYTILVGKSEGKRLLGRPRRRWKYHIDVDSGETGYEAVIDWRGSGWSPVGGSYETSVFIRTVNFLTSWIETLYHGVTHVSLLEHFPENTRAGIAQSV